MSDGTVSETEMDNKKGEQLGSPAFCETKFTIQALHRSRLIDPNLFSQENSDVDHYL